MTQKSEKNPDYKYVVNIPNDLFMLMLNLSQVKSIEKIIEIYLASINSIWSEIDFSHTYKSPKDSEIYFEIKEGENNFGYIIASSNFKNYTKAEQALIRNSIILLAVIIGNKYHEHILLTDKEILENHISRRTTEMKLMNAELLAANEEYMELIKELKEAHADITVTHKSLEKSEKKYRSYIDNSPEAIFIINKKGKLIECNDAVVRMSGYSSYELLGKRTVDFVLKEDAKESIVTSHGNSNHKRYELTCLHKNGTPFSLVVDSVGIEKDLYLCFAKDITYIKKTEEELNRAKEELEEALNIKDNFLSNMSHEIRTPLNGILGMAELALMTQLNEQQIDFIRAIHKSAQHLKRMVSQILSFSKIDAYNRIKDNNHIHLETFIAGILKPYEYAAQVKNIRLTFDIDNSLPEYILSSQGCLHEIIENLVDNAIKFTEKGEVSFTVRPRAHNSEFFDIPDTGDYIIMFIISDTGIGIPKSEHENIFETFYQIDSTATRKYGGTGLGLSVIKKLIQMNNGNIMVKKNKGSGTSFIFYLPVQIPSSVKVNFIQDEEEYNAEAVSFAKNKKNILVVEDNEINQKVIVNMLERQGHKAVCAENGAVALERLMICRDQECDYDLVLMDIQMPVMDGFEAVRKIKNGSTFPDIPIVAVTAHSTEEDKEYFKQAGFDDLLVKPVDKNSILQVLDIYL